MPEPEPEAEAEAEAEAGEGPVDVPFSPELGRAAVTPFGFAVGALSSPGGRGPGSATPGDRDPRAVVALLGRDGKSSVVEIGQASEPPRLVMSGDQFFVASVHAAARARELRVGTLVGAFERAELRWGGRMQLPSDPSSVLSVEAGSESVLVVWDERDADASASAIWGRRVSLAGAEKETDPVRLSPAGVDAQVPRLGLRSRGGYWLAYLTEQALAAALSAEAEPVEESEPAVRRTLMLASLNERGEPEAPAQRLGDAADHALLFDLQVLPDDRALLAVRQESTLPGSDAGSVELFLVAPGSAPKRTRIEVEDASPGSPVLIADAEPGRVPAAFVSVLARDGRTLLSAVQVDQGSRAGVFAAGPLEPRLGYAEPLAAARGKLSIATPRGGAMTLGLVACELEDGG